MVLLGHFIRMILKKGLISELTSYITEVMS